jgi:hypothetical protein
MDNCQLSIVNCFSRISDISFQKIRKRRMTGTNHSKTHRAVVPRIIDDPGGAAESISITAIIRSSAYRMRVFIVIIPLFHPLPHVPGHIAEPVRGGPFRITTNRGCGTFI